MEHGGDDIEIRVGVLEGEAGFFVADDGAGIPKEDREAVLESGFSTSNDGTGLAIVTEIVAAHGWQIRVTGNDSGGACFEISAVEFAD